MPSGSGGVESRPTVLVGCVGRRSSGELGLDLRRLTERCSPDQSWQVLDPVTRLLGLHRPSLPAGMGVVGARTQAPCAATRDTKCRWSRDGGRPRRPHPAHDADQMAIVAPASRLSPGGAACGGRPATSPDPALSGFLPYARRLSRAAADPDADPPRVTCAPASRIPRRDQSMPWWGACRKELGHVEMPP